MRNVRPELAWVSVKQNPICESKLRYCRLLCSPTERKLTQDAPNNFFSLTSGYTNHDY